MDADSDPAKLEFCAMAVMDLYPKDDGLLTGCIASSSTNAGGAQDCIMGPRGGSSARALHALLRLVHHALHF